MKPFARIELTPGDLGPREDAAFAWLACSDDGLRLAAGRDPAEGHGEIVVIDLPARRILRRLSLTNQGTGAFAMQSHRLELARHELDVDAGEVVARGARPSERCGGSGRVRVAQFENGTVELVSADKRWSVPTDSDFVSRVALSADDQTLYFCGASERIERRVASGGKLPRLDLPPWPSDFVATPRELIVAYAALERRGLVRADLATGKVLQDHTGDEASDAPYASALALDPVHGTLAVTRASQAEPPYDVSRRSWLELYTLER